METKNLKKWTEYLEEVCNCWKDENGNRMCDNGVDCDRCVFMEKEVPFEKWRRGEIE